MESDIMGYDWNRYYGTSEEVLFIADYLEQNGDTDGARRIRTVLSGAVELGDLSASWRVWFADDGAHVSVTSLPVKCWLESGLAPAWDRQHACRRHIMDIIENGIMMSNVGVAKKARIL